MHIKMFFLFLLLKLLMPFSFCRCACNLETAVNAVSDPEEIADNKSSNIIAINLIKINKVINLFF